MVIKDPHLMTQVDIWHPKYGNVDEPEAWISKSKVAHGSPVILVRFTKAKHLIGQRFAIKRSEIEKCPETTNGKIPVYRVALSKLESWQSAQEEKEQITKTLTGIGWWV